MEEPSSGMPVEPAPPAPPDSPPVPEVPPPVPQIPKPAVRWVAGMLVTAAAGLYIAMAEISRLSGDVLDNAGRSWPFSDLMGPSTVLDRSPVGWSAQGLSDVRLSGWLHWYLLLDLLFVLVYVVGLRKWLGSGNTANLVVVLGVVDLFEDFLALLAGRNPDSVGRLQAWLPCVSAIKWLLVAVLLVVCLRRLLDPVVGSAWRVGLKRLWRAMHKHRFSILAVLPVAVLSVIPGPDLLDQMPDVQRQWRDGGAGLGHGALASVALVVLAIALFVQGRMRSDHAHQRALDREAGVDNRPRPNLLIWLVGPVVIGVLLLLLQVWGVRGLSPGRFTVFAAVPLAIFGASAGLRCSMANGTVWPIVTPMLARPAPRPILLDQVPSIVAVGDGLAISALVMGGLGLVRSFTAVVALGSDPGSTRGHVLGWVLLLLGAIVALGFWPVAAWIVTAINNAAPGGASASARPARVVQTAAILTTGTAETFGPRTRRTMLAVSLSGFLLIGMAPWGLAVVGGVLACAVLSLTAFAVMIGSTVVLTQDGDAPEVFWPFRVASAPIATLLIVTVVWASSMGDSSEVHGVRGTVPSAASASSAVSTSGGLTRPDVTKAFTDWLADPATCRFTDHEANVMLRPMVLAAAEGGGIRAAYWTATSLDEMAGSRITAVGEATTWVPPTAQTSCGAHATLLSGGASGGAVGMTVGRFAEPGNSRAQVAGMADPLALGVGSVGLVVRDLLYSATGVPLPVMGSPGIQELLGSTDKDGKGWVDRAGLIEAAWQKRASALSTPFIPTDPGSPGVPTGHLVLSSTSVGTGCRLLVSQLALSPSGSSPSPEQASSSGTDTAENAPAAADCAGLDRPAAGSTDLLSDYDPATPAPAAGAKVAGRPAGTPAVSGVPAGEPSQDHCLGPLVAATAAMLASRFPYVTPSGVIGPCHGLPTQQVVDGGYVENSGLGTIVDLSTQWLPLVQAYNAEQLRRSDGGTPDLVVPVIVYLDNGTGSDLSPPTVSITNELLVPPTASGRAGKAQSDTPALLQRTAALADVGNLWDSVDSPPAEPGVSPTPRPGVSRTPQKAASDATAAIRKWRPKPVIVVHQSTFPAVTAPLGWVLSDDSMLTMDKALLQQSRDRCDPTNTQRTDALCNLGFGALADLLGLLKSP